MSGRNGNGKARGSDKPATGPSAEASVSAQQNAYLEALVEKEGMLTQACLSVGISRGTPWRWRKGDEEFRAREEVAMAEGAKRAVERKRDERKELAVLGRSRIRELLSFAIRDGEGNLAVEPKLIFSILRAAEYVTKNDPDDPFIEKQQVEHSGSISAAQQVHEEMGKIWADPELTRTLSQRARLSEN